MRSFCISLDKHLLDTWPILQREFAAAGIGGGKYTDTPVERISGLPGDATVTTVWTQYRLKNKLPRRHHEQLNNLNGIGCSLAHASVWQKIVDEQIPEALIFEDDVSFVADFQAKFNAMMDALPSDAQLCALGYILLQHPMTPVNSVIDQVTYPYQCTMSYMLTLAGAQELLKYFKPVETHVDIYIGILANLHPDFKVYAAHQAVCVHKDFLRKSDIGHDHLEQTSTNIAIISGSVVLSLALLGGIIFAARHHIKCKVKSKPKQK